MYHGVHLQCNGHIRIQFINVLAQQWRDESQILYIPMVVRVQLFPRKITASQSSWNQKEVGRVSLILALSEEEIG